MKIQKVLLVDDDEDDCSIFTDVIKEIDPSIKLVCITDARHLFLHATDLKPDLIFLDLGLPLIDGVTSLTYLKEHEELKKIPVVIYSGSNHPKQIEDAYKYGANLYVHKPASLKQITETIKSILAFDWEKPEEIISKCLVDGKFYPYTTEAG